MSAGSFKSSPLIQIQRFCAQCLCLPTNRNDHISTIQNLEGKFCFQRQRLKQDHHIQPALMYLVLFNCAPTIYKQSLIQSLIAPCVLLGNGMVIIGISAFKKLLRLTSNLFLTLVVADLLLAVLILPKINQVLGYWIFGGAVYCSVYLFNTAFVCCKRR